jgi:ABC-type polysaccharide/polyol phosphate export permease
MKPRPSPLENLLRLTALDLLWSTRVPQSLVYQFLVAAVLLVLLAQVNGSPEYLAVLVPGLIALATASGALQGIGTTVSYMRAYGAWRTVRGSPIPTPLYLGSMVISRMLRILLTVVVLLLVARTVYGFELGGSILLTFAYVALGVAVFGVLGLVVTYLVATPQAVSSVLNVVFLILLFSSNVLFVSEIPWFRALTLLSPLTFLGRLLRANAQGGGGGEVALSLAVLAAWLVVGGWAALALARKKVEEA